jgi:serine/threonine protein kinase
MAEMLRRQSTIKGRYSVDYSVRLGKGGFGEVYLGKDVSSGDSVAVKVVAPNRKSPSRDMYHEREVESMKSTDHPNLVRLVDYETIDHTSYIIMELCQKDLNVFAKEEREGLPRPLKRQFIKEVVLAIDYLHSKNIIHRDLKPENILVKIEADRTRLKVSDFALSKSVDGNSSVTATAGIGTPFWMAPEVVRDPERPEQQVYYGKASDCFAVGLILYAIVTHMPGDWLTTIKGIEAQPKHILHISNYYIIIFVVTQ